LTAWWSRPDDGRATVDEKTIGNAAGVLTAVVTAVVARITGRYRIVELAVAGVVGLLCYMAIAMPVDKLRRLAVSHGGGQAPA
jgi:hypothetical protein